MKSCKGWIIGTALLASVALVGAGCGGDDGGSGPSADVKKGGTYRIATVDFGFSNAFDPTGEYLGLAHGYYSNLLSRNLVGYRHRPGGPGNELVPDLADSVPEPSADGLTYTFKLKQGIKFGPPLDREITSKDIAFAFERIGTKSLAAQYGFYYDVIEGMAAFKDGSAKTISGIQTPDDKTITFKLTAPTGDFLYRLGMPATQAMPREVAGCFKNAGDYGRYVVASGPYMIDGSAAQDATSCKTLKPLSGWDPTKNLTFVRNPSYDPATDDLENRSANVDSVTVDINTNTQDIFDKIKQGQLDGSPDTPPNTVVSEYAQDAALKDLLKANSGDRTWFITMNTARAPFDDVNVRKAANFIVDKAAIQQAWGGTAAGAIAKHIVPDAMYGDAFPADYEPYPLDEAKAKEAMKASKYDTDKDGICDAPACKNVFHVSRNSEPWSKYNPVIAESFKKIGIELNTRELPTGNAYTTIQTVARNVPVASNAGWGKDYADVGTFAVLFQSATIIPTGNSNYSLIGLTAEQAKDLKVPVADGVVPSVEADIKRCDPLLGDERRQCWIDFDKKLMEEVVPWVPYLFANNIDVVGPAVTQYEFDQNSGEMAFAHLAVDPAKQK